MINELIAAGLCDGKVATINMDEYGLFYLESKGNNLDFILDASEVEEWTLILEEGIAKAKQAKEMAEC